MIFYYDEKPDGTDSDDWYLGRGWYWADETDYLIGPVDTEADALAASYRYAEWLTGSAVR